MRNKILVSFLAVCCALMTGILAMAGQTKTQNAPSTASTHFEKNVNSYHISLDAKSAPLKTEAETFLLKVHPGKEQAKPAVPQISVTMAMGSMVMKAPTTVKKAENGDFLVTTEFTMAGTWAFTVKPASNVEAVTFKVPVQ